MRNFLLPIEMKLKFKPYSFVFLIIIILGSYFTALCQPQVRTWASNKNSLEFSYIQWEVNDIVFKAKKGIQRPFEKEVFAIVTDETSNQKIPLFYNGNNEWVFRYSSSKTGKKTFVIESEIVELNGIDGTINIRQNEKEDRHGAVVLSDEDPQHLYYEDGSHYFNLASECDWLFALDYGHDDISKTEHLLSLLNENGFNQIVMNIYSYDVQWPKDSLLLAHPEHEYGGREDIFPFLGSNSNPDYSSLNVDFFKHFDKVISEMHHQEIVSHLMIYVWNKNVAWPDMQSEADNRYYDYIIKRYQAFPNIIWDVSKEALHLTRATKEYILERVERTRRIDSYDRLVSVHDYGFCRNNPDQVDFISMQNWKHTLYQNMLNARNDFPNKPIFNIEHGGYEESPYEVFPGAYTDAEACLRRNYMCLFAGGYTTYYWQGASWNALIHNPFEQDASYIKPHFDYFAHMRKLFKTVPFENCQPQFRYNSSGYNLTNKEDGIILLYTPKENQSISPTVQIRNEFDYQHATQQWFNTLTGEFTKEEPYEMRKWGFWDWRPWRGEADAIFIVRNLKPKEEKKALKPAIESITLKINKATTQINVDGVANEVDWQNATSHSFDYYYKYKKATDKQHTSFKMLWDEEHLYVLFEARDQYITARERHRDGQPYFDDCAELFLTPADEQINMHIGYEVNLYDVSNDFIYINDIHQNKDFVIKSFNPAFEVAHTIDGTINDNSDIDKGWTMEFAIPLSNFHINGPITEVKEGAVWTFLALRQDRNDPTGNRRSTSTLFPLVPKDYRVHDPKCFGRMIFVGEP